MRPVTRTWEKKYLLTVNHVKMEPCFNLQFVVLGTLHILIWAFVLLAFLHPRTAHLNLYYIIPMIYLTHILPFHILEHYEKQYCKDEDASGSETNAYIKVQAANILKIPKYFFLLEKCFENSFANPLSPQGMLIMGSLTSAYALKKMHAGY
jgi:hypothetical protein